MNVFRYAAISAVLLVAACSMTSSPMIVDGDRSAGKVISTTGPTTEAAHEIDWMENGAEAVRRCLEWGYAGAEPFEGITTDMLGRDVWGATIWRHSRIYQCTTDSTPQ